MTYVITRIHLLQSSSLTRALKRLKLKQKIAIRLTWVSEKFSKVVDVLAEERGHRQDVSLRSLILQAQRGQLGAAQVVKGGPEIKKNLKLFNETTASLPFSDKTYFINFRPCFVSFMWSFNFVTSSLLKYLSVKIIFIDSNFKYQFNLLVFTRVYVIVLPKMN
jgi:hypothetical protein